MFSLQCIMMHTKLPIVISLKTMLLSKINKVIQVHCRLCLNSFVAYDYFFLLVKSADAEPLPD